jgi:DNA-binding NarL/FixJ family response regulator
LEAIATVLIADDDPTLRRTARIILETNGYRVLEAENGDEALRLLRDEPPDVALVDVVMPITCGYEVLSGLRDSGDGAPPVIMMTGYASVDAVVGFMREGAFDCLAKPFGERDLLDRIERALGLASSHEDGEPGSPGKLSRREIDVLLLMREGMTNKEISERMKLGLRTIDEYVKRLCRKLGVSNRTSAVAWSYRRAMVDLDFASGPADDTVAG